MVSLLVSFCGGGDHPFFNQQMLYIKSENKTDKLNGKKT